MRIAFSGCGNSAGQGCIVFHRSFAGTDNWHGQLYYFPMPELPVLHPHKHEELILAGFRLEAGHDGPQVYTLLAVGSENERPISSDGRIVFFVDPKLATKALALDSSMTKLGPPPEAMETFCDVAEALYRVNSQQADPDGVILDCLLVFDDLVRATKLHMPDRYQGILTELAGRLTEGAQLRTIFTNPSLREHVEDALLWCVGAIAMKALIITK
jgi:hypothetical protein